jgi:SnoaL-like polyketide cyclase
MDTFGASARYDKEPWDDHHIGREAVRAYYEDLLRAVPDLAIDVWRRHVADDAVVLEVSISGHHLGVWRGYPRPGDRYDFHSAGFSPSTIRIGWRAKESITTALACYSNSAFSTNRTV